MEALISKVTFHYLVIFHPLEENHYVRSTLHTQGSGRQLSRLEKEYQRI